MPDTYEYIREGDWPGVQRLVDRLNQLSALNQSILIGTGAPTTNPGAGRFLYIRTDGGAATTLYVWEGASWVGK